ncbi:MAG: class I SAM-dependent RNA methyltransferase [Planctomycetaceae bacterium]
MPDLIATAAFGLEAVVSRELERLGYADRVVEDGKVTFAADDAAIARTNLWLRSADRVLLQVGEFTALDFGELFDQTIALPWEDWLPKEAAIPVEVRAVRSAIRSPRNAQSIVKKAVVTRLGEKYGLSQLPETGPKYPVDVAVRNDVVTIALDTSGAGLHKRGYRTQSGPAPLKETLAAGLVQLSYWNRNRPLADPFCGTGTIAIEAALLARNIAPGLKRSFLAESWPHVPSSIWKAARAEANALVATDPPAPILASDLDSQAVSTARRHASAAGVGSDVEFAVRPFQRFETSQEFGCLICNPPYGERLGEQRQLEGLYRSMNDLFAAIPTWSVYALTANTEFERLVRRRPDRKRKLYNGRIECTYYQFYGPRPPKSGRDDRPQERGVDAEADRSDDGSLRRS